jgi:protocatechuate 3,4-dioxygenase beta subunit
VAQAIGCRRRVEVAQAAGVQSPFLCGLRRPLLLLPARMCEASYRRDLPGILAHELTHVCSHDVLWNVGLQLVSIALWFHPLVWRVRKAHLAACELVCDAVSASFVGDVGDYCRTLARIAVDARASLPAAGIAMARTSAVSRRLGALKRKVFDMPLHRRSVMGFEFAALLTVAALGVLRFAAAGSPPAEPVAVVDKEETEPAKKEAKRAEKEAKPAKAADSKPQTGSMRVQVVNEAGKPIRGARIKVEFRGHKSEHTTDAAAKAVVAVPRPDAGFLSIVAYADGYPPLRKWWKNDLGNDAAPPEFTFAFQQGRTIGGVVRDEQGKPIQGVKVELNITPDDYERTGLAMALWEYPLRTDAEGRWHLDHAPQKFERMAIRLEHPDYINEGHLKMVSATEQKRMEDRTSVLVMKKGIPVTGTVTDPDGKPVADALVGLGHDRYVGGCLSTRTDRDGHWRFANLAPGGEVMTVVSAGLAPALREVNIRGGITPLDFRLEKGSTLRVRVVDTAGKPVEGVRISPDTWRSHRTLCDTGIAGTTDREGRWTWTWAPKDAVEMSIYKTGYMSIRKLPLAPKDTEQVVTLHPPLVISGRVVDAETKQPIPAFRVVRGSRQRGSSADNVYWSYRDVIEGKNGEYRLVIAEPTLAWLVVRIEAEGHQPGISREFKSDEGSVTWDASLAKGQTLDVLVRLPDGKPAAGADVRLAVQDGGKSVNTALFVKNGGFLYYFDPSKPSMKVAPDGRLRIDPQGNGFLLIVVHDRGYAQATSEELAANPTITLEAWARLEGVVRRGSEPAAGLELFAHEQRPHDPKWSFVNHDDSTETDAEGKFVFPKLRPGRWNITGAYGVPRFWTVDLAPGQTAKISR